MNKNDRKIILDTETTGMNFTGCFYENHKIIEIGAVEIVNNRFTGNNFHSYLQPNRLIEEKSFKIHGISNDFLLNKPEFRDIYKKFLQYIQNSTVIIHNAKFDVSFINYELSMLFDSSVGKISDYCNIIDTLAMARKIFPGKKNSLDALCNRYKITITHRKTHSAIIDAKLLAKVYIFMTNVQKSIDIFNSDNVYSSNIVNTTKKINYMIPYNSVLLLATQDEINQHQKYLKYMQKKTGKCIWIQNKYN